jgi:hypothetical protein
MSAPSERQPVEAALASLTSRLDRAASIAPGAIVFRLTGPQGGTYRIEHDERGTRLETSDQLDATAPLIEVMGDAATLRAILEGERDAREQFLEGGLRVRGDLRFLSNLAMELGLLKAPL